MATRTEILQTVRVSVTIERGMFWSDSYVMSGENTVEDYVGDFISHLKESGKMRADEVQRCWTIEAHTHRRVWDDENE